MGLADVGGPQNVTVTSCKAHPDYEFQTLAQIAEKTRQSAVEVFGQWIVPMDSARQSAGINRPTVGDERALQERNSDPFWPRVLRVAS